MEKIQNNITKEEMRVVIDTHQHRVGIRHPPGFGYRFGTGPWVKMSPRVHP